MSELQTPRFIAPHFIEIEGGVDVPGPVRRACAFTTAAPGWPRDASGATHHHLCVLLSENGRWHETGAVQWRTEGRALSSGEPPAVATGRAPDLMRGIVAALGAAHAPVHPRGDATPPAGTVLCVAPAFVPIAREPGLPGIWACSHLSAAGPVSAEHPWTHLQTAFIRAWPGGEGPAFRCELETLSFSAVMSGAARAGTAARETAFWSAASLEEAMQSCQARIFAPRTAAAEDRR
ncbi:hypothetical protein E0493_19505 [Roseomonas sp. M0104]|uniref:Uncharacterized protein n=1 Tax=Teichococcus coralli TaxID=2545983 RepID=A0A845BFB6_9PROT|nr:hypothetical protein [Pseudoroseomonas coralli]MXP65538.1 hypothetical protein [Pseudoroseomonas coralli]